VPAGSGPTLVAAVATNPEWTPPKVEVGSHRVRSGETLGQIAARYGTSVKTLMSMNNLRSANRLSVGQRLRVPASGGSRSRAEEAAMTPVAPREAAASRVAASAPASSSAATGEAVIVEYRVRSGDNLWEIATRFGTSADAIRAENGLKSNLLQIGQTLRIRSSRDRVGG
jgi:membrane-bound lytic murein transglycosylase D